ncbi:hypothetical protein KUV47_09135 [Vannielia litorea]|uniref:hypothetical protein n=1 Tax=Vannielia litorea TaxID=1217970 RepID=UPI001C977311|nr:hypothetical protein [Vannielia litorea]MBY6153374.1 hypothetical protein [Vannielia litorea]
MCEEQNYIHPITAFDDVPRDEQEPASHLVGEFDYLNRSGRPEAAAVRALVDQWLTDYPAAHRPEMVRRLRSRGDTLHRSSLFELMLHALLVRQGFRVIEIEPELPNGRAPDFLVEMPNGTRFFLEATLATGMDQASAGADRRMREALQAIDEVESPDFFLQLRTTGMPTQPIALRQLRRSLQRFVESLDYDRAVESLDRGLDEAPVWQHIEHNTHFIIHPFPKNVRREGGRAVGVRMLPGGIIHPEAAIRSAVENKAGRYGEIDLPLIIAVNALEEYANVEHAIDALFGTTSVVVREGCEPQAVRNPDGAWRGPVGAVNTRSSAVLFVARLSAWSVAQRSLSLVINPWARNPIGDIPLGVEVRKVIDERLHTQAGQKLREIFNIPDGWPE